MDVEQSMSRNEHKSETAQCYAWDVAYELFQSSPGPFQKKNLASHSYILPKENAFFCTCNSEHDYSTANTDSAAHISYLTPKISVLVHV